jgi:hypothetical protein
VTRPPITQAEKDQLLHRLYQRYAYTDGRPRCMRPEGHPAGRTHTCIPAPAGYQPLEVTA